MTPLSPDAALDLLKEGNRRFLEGKPFTPVVDRRTRLDLAAAQHPFAAYLSCSDSRVPPELLFERGLGELFIVRNAGNCLCNTAIGSLEFAVVNLGVPLIVVMGHQQCGVIRAAVGMVREQRRYSARIDAALSPLLPAVLTADPWADDLVDAAARAHVRAVVHSLMHEASPMISDRVRDGRLKIVGAFYSLMSGAVEFFEQDRQIAEHAIHGEGATRASINGRHSINSGRLGEPR